MSHWFRRYGFADILEDLAVGAYPTDAEDVATLEGAGIRRVLNLVAEEEYRPGEREAVAAAYGAAGIQERRLSLVDYGGLPAEAIETAVAVVLGWLEQGLRTYVHCRAGWQRSAAIAAGVVAIQQGLDIEPALAFVRARKPTAEPLPHQVQDLRRWWRERAVAA